MIIQKTLDSRVIGLETQSQSLDDPEWLIYYPDEKTEEHEELIAAEKEAREKQVGLWKEELQQ